MAPGGPRAGPAPPANGATPEPAVATEGRPRQLQHPIKAMGLALVAGLDGGPYPQLPGLGAGGSSVPPATPPAPASPGAAAGGSGVQPPGPARAPWASPTGRPDPGSPTTGQHPTLCKAPRPRPGGVGTAGSAAWS